MPKSIHQPKNPSDFGFFANYISIGCQLNADLIAALKLQSEILSEKFSKLSQNELNFAYASEKWTVKQNLPHITDTERVFSYRALRFGRGDIASLPGFDQDVFMQSFDIENVSVQNLIQEFMHVRLSTIALFEMFTEEQLDWQGTASNQTLSPRALGWAILGHTEHHINLIQTKYFPNF